MIPIRKQILTKMRANRITATAFANDLARRGLVSRAQSMKFIAGTSDTTTANADQMLSVLAKMKRKGK